MLISVKLLAKYAIIIYTLGHEKFGIWIKAVPKSHQCQNPWPGYVGSTAEPSQIEVEISNWLRRWTLHVLNSMC